MADHDADQIDIQAMQQMSRALPPVQGPALVSNGIGFANSQNEVDGYGPWSMVHFLVPLSTNIAGPRAIRQERKFLDAHAVTSRAPLAPMCASPADDGGMIDSSRREQHQRNKYTHEQKTSHP